MTKRLCRGLIRKLNKPYQLNGLFHNISFANLYATSGYCTLGPAACLMPQRSGGSRRRACARSPSSGKKSSAGIVGCKERAANLRTCRIRRGRQPQWEPSPLGQLAAIVGDPLQHFSREQFVGQMCYGMVLTVIVVTGRVFLHSS